MAFCLLPGRVTPRVSPSNSPGVQRALAPAVQPSRSPPLHPYKRPVPTPRCAPVPLCTDGGCGNHVGTLNVCFGETMEKIDGQMIFRYLIYLKTMEFPMRIVKDDPAGTPGGAISAPPTGSEGTTWGVMATNQHGDWGMVNMTLFNYIIWLVVWNISYVSICWE